VGAIPTGSPATASPSAVGTDVASHMRKWGVGRAYGLLTRHVRTVVHTPPQPSPALRRLYTHTRVCSSSTSPLSSPPTLGAYLSKRTRTPSAMSTSSSEVGDAVERTQRYDGPVGREAISAQLNKLNQALPGFVLKVSCPPNAFRVGPFRQREPRSASAAARLVALCLSCVRMCGEQWPGRQARAQPVSSLHRRGAFRSCTEQERTCARATRVWPLPRGSSTALSTGWV
jgi:hypothetical protein